MLKGLAKCHLAGSDLRCPTLFLNSSHVEHHYSSSTSPNPSRTWIHLGSLVKMQSLPQWVPAPSDPSATALGTGPHWPLPASILPLSCGPLPNENPVEIVGSCIRDFSAGCVGPGETNSPGCGAQLSGETPQSTRCSPPSYSTLLFLEH